MALIVVTVIYLVSVLVHDWVPMFPLNDLVRQSEHPIRIRALVELGNVLPIGVILVLAVIFPEGRLPLGASIYIGAYLVIFAALAWLSWYQPYFFGTSPARESASAREYGRTVQVLPSRGGRVRPNLVHLVLHVMFLAVAIVALTRIF
jgi:hypothetical protein